MDDARSGAGAAEEKSEEYKKHSMVAMARHVQGMLDCRSWARLTFDYGNNIETLRSNRA